MPSPQALNPDFLPAERRGEHCPLSAPPPSPLPSPHTPPQLPPAAERRGEHRPRTGARRRRLRHEAIPAGRIPRPHPQPVDAASARGAEHGIQRARGTEHDVQCTLCGVKSGAILQFRYVWERVVCWILGGGRGEGGWRGGQRRVGCLLRTSLGVTSQEGRSASGTGEPETICPLGPGPPCASPTEIIQYRIPGRNPKYRIPGRNPKP